MDIWTANPSVFSSQATRPTQPQLGKLALWILENENKTLSKTTTKETKLFHLSCLCWSTRWHCSWSNVVVICIKFLCFLHLDALVWPEKRLLTKIQWKGFNCCVKVTLIGEKVFSYHTRGIRSVEWFHIHCLSIIEYRSKLSPWLCKRHTSRCLCWLFFLLFSSYVSLRTSGAVFVF